jgi:hypothetical protein
MYVLEVYHKKEWEFCKTSEEKKSLEEEAEELNKLVPKEIYKFLPVSRKYRVRKIKKSDLNAEN